MPLVLLGNPSALDVGRPIPGHQITVAPVPDFYTREEQMRTLFHLDANTSGVWPMHSAAPAPSWVECPDDPELAAAISAQTGCPIGRPADFVLGGN